MHGLGTAGRKRDVYEMECIHHNGLFELLPEQRGNATVETAIDVKPNKAAIVRAVRDTNLYDAGTGGQHQSDMRHGVTDYMLEGRAVVAGEHRQMWVGNPTGRNAVQCRQRVYLFQDTVNGY